MKLEKRSSRHNAIRHGIFAKIVLYGPGFDELKEDFEKLISDWRAAIHPVDDLEETLVEKLAALTLRLRRVHRADFKSAPKLFARVKEGLEEDQVTPKLEFIERENQIVVTPNHPPFESLSRYEVHLEKQISRTLDQIAQLRRMREGQSQNSGGSHA